MFVTAFCLLFIFLPLFSAFSGFNEAFYVILSLFLEHPLHFLWKYLVAVLKFMIYVFNLAKFSEHYANLHVVQDLIREYTQFLLLISCDVAVLYFIYPYTTITQYIFAIIIWNKKLYFTAENNKKIFYLVCVINFGKFSVTASNISSVFSW